MSEDREKYTTTPHVRHTTFGRLPIGARFLFGRRDANSAIPFTKLAEKTYDSSVSHHDWPSNDVGVTWLTDAEVEAELWAIAISSTAGTDPPPTAASELARLVELEGRVIAAVKKMTDCADREKAARTYVGSTKESAYRHAIDLLEAALAGGERDNG